jgi:hypothetical protein
MRKAAGCIRITILDPFRKSRIAKHSAKPRIMKSRDIGANSQD